MRHLKSSAVTGCAVALSLCIWSGGAWGQTDEQRAGARTLATEGAAAFNDGRYKDAVDLFTKAETLMHAPPHLLYVARANSKLGQYVKAREAYLRITKEQLAPNAPQAFKDAQNTAQKELNAINPKIGSLEIKVEGAEAAKDLSIKIDGNPIPSVLVGVPQPIDPGEHRLEASATGFRAQPQTVRLGDGDKLSAVLKLEADASAAGPGGVPGAPPAGGQPGTTAASGAPIRDTSSSMDSTSSSNGMRIGAYAALGVGAVGLGVGTVFLLQALGKRSDADGLCGTSPDGRCAPDKKDEILKLDDQAASASTISIIGYSVGGVGVAAGVVMLIMSSRSESSAAARPAIYPWVGANSAGVVGRF